MSKQYIVQHHDGRFLAQGANWSAEYPNARIFPNLQAARRAVDSLKGPIAPLQIYSTDDYAEGREATATV